MPSANGSYSRLAGKQADEIWVDYEIFKISHRINYLIFTTFNISAMLLYVALEMHFSGFSQV